MKKDGSTPLLAAAQQGSLAIVRLMLEAGAAVGAARRDGTTPLIVAAELGHHLCTAELLKRGAPTDARARDGTTPLLAAADAGHHSIVALLLKAGPPKSAFLSATMAADGSTPLLLAVQNGHRAVVAALLQTGADPNVARRDGVRPLALATEVRKKGASEQGYGINTRRNKRFLCIRRPCCCARCRMRTHFARALAHICSPSFSADARFAHYHPQVQPESDIADLLRQAGASVAAPSSIPAKRASKSPRRASALLAGIGDGHLDGAVPSSRSDSSRRESIEALDEVVELAERRSGAMSMSETAADAVDLIGRKAEI